MGDELCMGLTRMLKKNLTLLACSSFKDVSFYQNCSINNQNKWKLVGSTKWSRDNGMAKGDSVPVYRPTQSGQSVSNPA